MFVIRERASCAADGKETVILKSQQHRSPVSLLVLLGENDTDNYQIKIHVKYKHTHTHTSLLSRLIRGFRNKYH